MNKEPLLDSIIQINEIHALDSKKTRLTSDGYLVAEPRIARSGIQIYKGWEIGRPEMDDVRVYRPDAEVFSHGALTSMAHKPITLDHPDTRVDSGNWKEHSVGHSGGDIARDGEFVRVPLVLMDAAAISAVQSGKSQLSVGYGAKLKWEPGQTPDGQMYDAAQSEIRANHIAIVTSARGGDKLKLGDDEGFGDDEYFDRTFSPAERKAAAKSGAAMPGGGYPIKTEADFRNAVRAIGRAKNPGATKAHIKKRARALGLTKLIPATWDSEGNTSDQQRRSTMSDRVLNLDGVNITLEDKDGQILERHLKTLDSGTADLRKQLDDAETEREGLTTKVAELTKAVGVKDGEIEALKQKVSDSKLTPEMLDKELNVRMEVVDRATAFFGDTKYGWKGKSNEQIRRDVVAAKMGDQRAKTMDDARIEGAFLSITDEPGGEHDGFQRMASSFSGRPTNSGINDKAAAAYDKRSEELQNAWKKNKTRGGVPI